MHNSGKHITEDKLDGLLRQFLLEKNNKPEVLKAIEMQSTVVFSQKNSTENLSSSEKIFIEKLAKEKGYISSKGNNRGLFTWIFSSLFILLFLLFVWKLFIMADNNVKALQTQRDSFNFDVSTNSHEEVKPETPAKFSAITINKTDTTEPIVVRSRQTEENESYFANNKFPYKQPKIVYSKGEDIFLNLDFEVKAPGTNLPDIWYAGDGGKIGDNIYTVKIDSAVKYSGNNSIMFQRIEKKPNTIVFGCLTNSIPPEYFRDKDSITISAYIKTENVQGGNAALWCTEWNDAKYNNKLPYANSILQGGTGSSDWKKYSISLPIDTGAKSLTFGGFLNNTGTAWFDDFEVSIDGEKITEVVPVVKSPEAKEIEWLNTNCIPIKTLDVGNGFDDLKKLNDIVGDAQIVALGGSSYGSSEEIMMKQRITEFLASEKGFNIICLDAGMPEVSMLNNYIHTGEGDPLKILDTLHSLNYNCNEMLNVTEWLRGLNQKDKDKLALYGTGFNDKNALQAVKDFAIKNDSKFLKQVLKYEEALSEIKGKIKNYKKHNPYLNVWRTEKLSKKIMPLMDKLCTQFENNKEKYLKNNTISQYEWIKQMLMILKQSLTQTISSQNYYNQFWADNIQWILKQNPDARIIIWNINSAIDKENKWSSAGTLLSNEYGNKYKAIGFATDSGTYSCYKDSVLSINEMLPSIKGSYEDYFSECKYSNFILDLRKSAVSEPSAKWLDSEMWLRHLFNIYNDKQFFRMKIVGNYDAIVFIRNTTHSECFDFGKKIKTTQ